MASDLDRGAYSGKETFLYYNTATSATPTWAEIPRARNVQMNRGPNLAEIEFHGASETSNIPGYKRFSGSFEYVRKKGTDTVFAALESARDAGDILQIGHLNGPVNVTGSVGWKCPVLLGEFSETANGNDGVVVTIPFAKADAYLANGDAVECESFTGSTPSP